ncbi:hypothetical protein EWM64_g1589 [Hericium alpestre]|uniref:Uncharacterized protein n=1 Tax=Hericium alpestre TaxID=135208 RepID=A0A4Z0A7G1_9AGAM|nr:hypothetical protein EWM64_g1589 [Hericium alpestre]
MHHPEFPVVTLISALALFFPLPWHLRAGNVAMVAMVFWLFWANIIYFVDSIVWAGNVNIVAVAWCDITTKVIIGANVALPAACLAVCVHLEQLASVRSVLTTKSSKQRRQLIEAALCFGLPIIVMALHYTVQGHRFDVIEDYGCRPSTYVSWPAILLIWVLPLLLAILTLGFATAAFTHFMRRRVDFARHLENRSALTTTRYMRLIIMSAVQMVWGVAITSYALWFATLTYRPYTNWADVHFDFSRIDQYVVLLTPPELLTNLEVLWWAVPVSTWIFILFFAFGHDAMAEYRACVLWFRRRVLRQQVVEKHNAISSIGSRPAIRPPPISSFGGMSMSTLVANDKGKSSATLPLPPSPPLARTKAEGYEASSPHSVSEYTASPTESSFHTPPGGLDAPPPFEASHFPHPPRHPVYDTKAHDLA